MRSKAAIFVAGAAVQWLRDGLQADRARRPRSRRWPQQRRPGRGVYLVPAFAGLGAPYWDAEARGAIFGLTRDTGRAEIAARHAGSRSATRRRDLIDAMRGRRRRARRDVLRVDGGMVVNDWLMQCLADMLGAPVERPR